MLAEGTPRLGLVALIRPGFAPGRCLHLLGQLLGAAGRDKRSLAADRDPHAFQGVEQNAPPGESGPELASVVSRLSIIAWHGVPQLLRACLFSQNKAGEPEPLGNVKITSGGVVPRPTPRGLSRDATRPGAGAIRT